MSYYCFNKQGLLKKQKKSMAIMVGKKNLLNIIRTIKMFQKKRQEISMRI